MKRIFLKASLMAALLASAGHINSQVTIGSSKAPEKGALLMLDDGTTGSNGQNASKGLGLPRVNISNQTPTTPAQLSASIGATGSWDLNEHVGLTVYNINKCIDGGQGMYVWTGTEWYPLKKNTFTPTLSSTYFNIPSGRDARGTKGTVASQDLIITHNNNATATWTMGQGSIAGAGNLVPFNPALTNGALGASPYTMTFKVDAMTDAEVTTNPWRSKESKLTFTNLATECGQQAFVTINQTNYALKANNVVGNSQIVYTPATNGNFNVQSNAVWKISKTDPNNVLASLTPAIGSENGQELKNNATPPAQAITYSTNAGQKYHNATITFSDTASVKRFDDVNVTILNCNNTNDPTIEQWAERVGFNATEIAAVTNALDPSVAGGTSSAIKNGYQLHRDQSGNLFISSEFGLDAKSEDGKNRWMIVNLAATSFATTGRTGHDGQVNRAFGASVAVPSAANNYAEPLWCYPKTPTTATTYTNNPRIGLLYNWAAATNGKGRYRLDGTVLAANGQASINDGEDQATPQQAKIQGICPNGWHLPSDVELTALEEEINRNTSRYAGIPDANGTITKGQNAWRGSTHGQGMKDACPAPGETTTTNGSSNVMSAAVSGGFGTMLAGAASLGSAFGYGASAYMWSASGDSTNNAWYRYFDSTNAQVARSATTRYNLFSVRCKKD